MPEIKQWQELEALLESLAPGFEELELPDLAARELELLEDLARAEVDLKAKGEPK
jgi:hypothetical protein